jgi:PII-like signaling protein
VRLHVNGSARRQGRPLYQAVVESARARHLAGASVFLVDLSFGARRRLRDARSEYGFVDIPVVIEVVDAPERIEPWLGQLATMVAEGFATVEPVRVLRYGPPDDEDLAPPDAEAGPERTANEEVIPMRSDGPAQAQRITVYIGNSDTWRGRNLALAIVERCRTLGIAGATASLGVMGFGKNSRIHRAQLLGLSEDLPERIEIVDSPDRIGQLVPVLEEMVGGGLILVEDVRVIQYRPHPD